MGDDSRDTILDDDFDDDIPVVVGGQRRLMKEGRIVDTPGPETSTPAAPASPPSSPPAASQDLKSQFAEDEAEIERTAEKEPPEKIDAQEARTIESFIESSADEAMSVIGLPSENDDMRRRFRTIAAAYFNDLRDTLETKSKLTMEKVSGGMGMTDEQAGKVMGTLTAKLAEFESSMQSRLQVERKDFVAKRAGRQLTEREEFERQEQASLDRTYARVTGTPPPEPKPEPKPESKPEPPPKVIPIVQEKKAASSAPAPLPEPKPTFEPTEIAASRSAASQSAISAPEPAAPAPAKAPDIKAVEPPAAGSSPEDSFDKFFDKDEEKTPTSVGKPSLPSDLSTKALVSAEASVKVGAPSPAGGGGTPPSLMKEKWRGAPISKPAPKPVAPVSPPTPATDKPIISDVKTAPTKLVGPVEEIRSISIRDFRRFSKDPNEATLRIKDKIDLLENQSFSLKTAGIAAWRESPVYKLYLEILRQSLEGKPVSNVMGEMEARGEDVLTKVEFDAIMALNRTLRFG